MRHSVYLEDSNDFHMSQIQFSHWLP